MKRLPLAADFVLFIALCASLAYWGMLFFKPQSRPVAPPPQQMAPPIPPIEAATGLFGGRPAGAVAARNFLLKGVIAAGPDGVAILSADGKPPQAVGVGMEAEPGVTVKEVYATYVLLNEGGMIKRVDLPENAKGGLEIGGPAPASPSAAPMLASSSGALMPAGPPGAPMPAGPSGASMPAPAMNANNGQMPNQHSQFLRPRGIGPGAWGAKPTPMPPPGPQPVGPN